jgi:hypothetical protein
MQSFVIYIKDSLIFYCIMLPVDSEWEHQQNANLHR